ncbi:MAG: carboxyl transferase domain-containing protein, partial [Acidobacteriota bacterium]|nr:carboxyl transferase domain-containing protein [Acidobacteriota bacterium]
MTDGLLKEDGRIAIINRGEPAIRFLNAVADFNAERGTSLQTIALYTKPDQHARFVQRADSAWFLGDVLEPDPAFPDEEGNPTPRSPYLIYERLKRALRASRATAVWVGWGFVAEHAAFADLCAEMGVVFIGPSGDTMRALGDKIGSKLLAEECGVPVSPWSGGPVKSVAAARRAAKEIGLPLVIKATAGGGGRGIRPVYKQAELKDAFESATSEAQKAFGDGTVFMEKMILDARHLEVQVVADYRGKVWAAGIRDCSVQRRNQKVIEEGPAVILDEAEAERLREYARGIARGSAYRNAGTAEFLYEPESGDLYFMEMNTRLQVEHPVTEITTGLDLVMLQLGIAMGEPLEGEPPPTRGHAVEVRLNAEDPYNQFAPSPGRIDLFSPPGGPGVRVDSGVETHSDIPAAFDSMIAKVIAWGHTREQAVARVRRALMDTAVVVRDGTTNKAFLLDLLEHETYVENKVTTAWLDGLMRNGGLKPARGREAALIVGCIECYVGLLHRKRREFFQTVSRGRTRRLPVASTAEVELRFQGVAFSFRVGMLEPEYYRIHYGEGSFDVRLVRDTPYNVRLFYNQKKYACTVTERGDNMQVDVEGACYLVERDSGGVVRSQSPAVVLKVHVSPGDHIREGDPLVTLEAMKMEMLFLSPETGVVKNLLVKKADQVGAGDPMVVLESNNDDDSRAAAPVVDFYFNSLPEPEDDPDYRLLREVRAFMLGFDVHHYSLRSLMARIPETIHRLGARKGGRRGLITFFQAVFEAYFDIEFLFLKKVSVSTTDISSPQQHFFTFLQLLGSGKEHPATDFMDYLTRALAHYDLTLDNPTEELEEALIRICYSHHHARIKRQLLIVVREAFSDGGVFSNQSRQLRQAVEWIIDRSHRHFNDIHELSIDFYYRFFGDPELDRGRRSRWGSITGMLERLQQESENLDELKEKISHYPFPILKFILDRIAEAEVSERVALVEVLLRRINLDAGLSDLTVGAEQEIAFAHAEYTRDRSLVLALSMACDLGRLSEAMSLSETMIQTGRDRRAVIDFYLTTDRTLEPDEYAAMIEEHLDRFPKMPQVSRIRFAIGDSFPCPRFFHYRIGPSGYKEKRIYRGIPEFAAKRFNVERLHGFLTKRLPTPEIINLFYCVAEENKEDQRLIAFSEVREKPPERQMGSVFTYPALRRHLLRLLNTLRRQQESFPKKESFYWNQIIVYVRPLITVSRDAFLSFLRRVLAGYEQVKLERIRVYLLMNKPYGDVENQQVEVLFPADMGMELRFSTPTTPAIEPLSQRDFQLALARRRGFSHPYEIIALLTGGYFYPGEFQEYVLEHSEADAVWPLVSLDDPTREIKRGGMMAGIISNYTPAHPEGMRRVILLSDANMGLGCLAELECRVVIGAINLAEREGIPVEWFPVSSGARISMDSGTENLDWTARALRAIIEFTQRGGEINLVVDGINVGAQSYWNAEATMMMHNRGCLIMTPRGTMVLTGKGALDYAGSVSAEDNLGIGGLERIMGPNGQVHYPARDLLDACDILLRYYAVTYVSPGERFPRKYQTDDPADRDARASTYSFEATPDYKRIGDIFDEATNPGKKKPFDIRQVLRAVADEGREPLERWPLLAGGETTVVMDTTIGGICTSIIGIQSHPLERRGYVPNDGPDSWSGGTLFPASSKKLARAINAASGCRPVVILANLSGFDGSPESLRRLQLEYGAEIGRAMVNFRGPAVFCVVSRYHGGAFVVFSKALNANLQVAALEGAYASVIGGAPAAAVVFARDVKRAASEDPRVVAMSEELKSADG